MNVDQDEGGGAANGGGAADGEALRWAIRMGDDQADWDAFTDWLEADPAHADAYDQAVASLDDAEAMIATVPATSPLRAPEASQAGTGPGQDVQVRRPRSRIGGAVAAGLLAAVGIGLWGTASDPYAIETAAGRHRAVPLPGGSTVVLAGGSRLRLDHTDTRVATLERGQVLFRVRHDPSRPFRVRVGGLALVDLGTTFDVKMIGPRVRVAVAEGEVLADPDGAAVRLLPGQALLSDGSTLQRRAVDVADVGAWREGRLAFDEAPLAEVAADLSRHLGRRIEAVPAVAGRTFRGTLDMHALRDRPELLGLLLGLSVRREPGGWILEPHR